MRSLLKSRGALSDARSATTPRTRVSHWAGSPRSTTKAAASPPAPTIVFTTASTPAASRSTTATRAPSSAKRQAVARPIEFYLRKATCWRPEVKGLNVMVNSSYNGWRFEDVWLDK